MAHIKSIRFDRAGKNDGCICDRCGQYIQNIFTVQFTDGITMNYGIDCFEKLKATGNLNVYGKKLLNKSLKNVEFWYTELKKWNEGEYTEENRYDFQNDQKDKQSYWFERSFDEYKEWMIQKFIPARIEYAQKDIDRFSKVNFAR